MASLVKNVITALLQLSMRNKMRKRAEREKWQAESRANWHARLPPAYSTEGNTPVIEGIRDVSTQQQSLFFAKLPIELRNLIYTYALGGEQLQLRIVGAREYDKAPFKLRCVSAQHIFAFPKSCKLV